jgi:hypothetical protein
VIHPYSPRKEVPQRPDLSAPALCCLQLVDVPELEEEGKEDLTRRVRRWYNLCV